MEESAGFDSSNMKWSDAVGPMGVSRDQVVLEWLKQPGNYERFIHAGGVAKRLGKAKETKHEVAKLVCTLLQNAGFEDMKAHPVAIKLSMMLKRFKQAHGLSAVGASRKRILRVCPHYYELVDHIKDVDCGEDREQDMELICKVQRSNIINGERRRVTTMADHGNNFTAQEAQSTRTTTMHVPNNSHSEVLESFHHRQLYQMMNQLLKQQQQIMEQQSRRDRLQELELHVSLIQRMTEAGFTKEEIGEHLAKLR
ncbi:predicted protein [Lichtheimia corymbifera JMRC:FSU:9682]|uniref:Uncharacterized protein n=1 Tax=Lichtheimia corymbifera JMRC:FSU:9682 TaxID=1263082 RepID=A0A068SEV3_9FUNG|nr:predicted protein [Lichtheimia corymbifera JMRC:FSU:9682]